MENENARKFPWAAPHEQNPRLFSSEDGSTTLWGEAENVSRKSKQTHVCSNNEMIFLLAAFLSFHSLV